MGPKAVVPRSQAFTQTICQEHLGRHAHEGDAFLHQTVTGDESYVYHYEPQSKRQSMQWKHPSSPANRKFKTQTSAGKVMLTSFWEVSGPILVHFQEKGQTMTSAQYNDILVNELKPAV
jgi:histone-lysine N-methyltransferase SETMAR